MLWPRREMRGDPVRLRAWVFANDGGRGDGVREPGDLLFGSAVYRHLREPAALPSPAEATAATAERGR